MCRFVFILVLVITPCVFACGEDPVTRGGCRCASTTSINGETVPYAGCGNHIGDSCFCYVRNPNDCDQGDVGDTTIRTDPLYTNTIKWRDCGENINTDST